KERKSKNSPPGRVDLFVSYSPMNTPFRGVIMRLIHFMRALRSIPAIGYPNKLLHDFRRTAVRNLERAGVPRSSAMKMVGHATESIYRRYAIQDEAMLREATAKLQEWTEAQSATTNATRAKGQVRRFARRGARR